MRTSAVSTKQLRTNRSNIALRISFGLFPNISVIAEAGSWQIGYLLTGRPSAFLFKGCSNCIDGGRKFLLFCGLLGLGHNM